jgi:hypothetical protein
MRIVIHKKYFAKSSTSNRQVYRVKNAEPLKQKRLKEEQRNLIGLAQPLGFNVHTTQDLNNVANAIEGLSQPKIKVFLPENNQ